MSLSAYGRLPAPRLTPDMLALVKTGEVFSLGVDYQEGMLTPGPVMKSYSIAPHLRHSDPSDINPGSAAAEVIQMSIHVGTHIDALCHIAEKQDENGNPHPDGEPRLYAGLSLEAARFLVKQGMRLASADNMAVEAMPPSDHAVHRFLLVHNGITHLENLCLDDLAGGWLL